MKKSAFASGIYLQPGEVYFGDRDTQISTLLGSCVAITLWHPHLLIGGMCHYMLPTRQACGQKFHRRIRNSPISFPSRRAENSKAMDGKYADEALELMFSEIQRRGTRVNEYQIKLFGGGNMFPSTTQLSDHHVGLKNIQVASELLTHHGLKVSAEHLGGIGHRNLIFNIGSGDVWMKHQTPIPPPCDKCEARKLCLHV